MNKTKIISILISFLIVFSPVVVNGQDLFGSIGDGPDRSQIDPSFGNSQEGIVPSRCDDGTCGLSDVATLITNVINWMIGFSAAVAAIMFAYAGFLFITAGGSLEQIKKAKGTFKTVAIGLIIIIAAFFLVRELVELITHPNTNFAKILGG